MPGPTRTLTVFLSMIGAALGGALACDGAGEADDLAEEVEVAAQAHRAADHPCKGKKDGKSCSFGCMKKGKCHRGRCQGAKPSHCGDGTLCTDKLCDRKTGRCSPVPKPNGTRCKGGCIADGVCAFGACSALATTGCDSTLCIDAVCEPDRGSCTQTPKPNGTRCQGGCVADGVCAFGACSALATTGCQNTLCAGAACQEATGVCLQTPLPNGTPCSGGCVVGGVCAFGRCFAQTTSTCVSGPCITGVCDEETGICAVVPAPNGTPCGDACNQGGVCAFATCQAFTPRPNGTPCDGACMKSGTCSAGVCDNGIPEPNGTACIERDLISGVCAIGRCEASGP